MSILDNFVTAIFNPPRSIGSIAIQCTIEERHYDELTITDHPVEQGAMITDHAFKRPAEVAIRAGWSNSGIQSVITDLSEVASLFDPLNAGLEFGFNTSPFNYADQVYQQLLTLQNGRQPFQIITGKRIYQNMLIRSLAVTTDEKSEHSLFCTAVCREVIIVQTQSVSFTPMENQADPQKTAQTQNNGVQALTPGAPSPGGAAPPDIAAGSW